ncbi:Very-short-patch-repair endonuclease [Enterobacter sp. NFR05]|nr:Very-short-patch-repair endonuclease [Enterobacter sp. NFR05]
MSAEGCGETGREWQSVGMEIIRSHAKQLRHELTQEERRLWYLLRSRRFSRYKFRRQHPVGHYILDFACCEARLAIELDGGQHDERYEYDVQRTVWLNKKGWMIIRFWNNELWQNEEAVLERIFETLQMLLPSPRPSP